MLYKAEQHVATAKLQLLAETIEVALSEKRRLKLEASHDSGMFSVKTLGKQKYIFTFHFIISDFPTVNVNDNFA